MNTHLYLRASTKDQDAHRAKVTLEQFAAEKGLDIIGVYAENISGTKLYRPQLIALLDSAAPGEVLLVESVDRLSRLSQTDWDTLKTTGSQARSWK
jgi:DNA invertase Pin-like site-specific DNA recombinase